MIRRSRKRKPSRIIAGRTILNGADYHLLRVAKCMEAKEECQNAKCGKYAPLHRGNLHHIDGRGMGGGKRDDLKTVWVCEGCHMAIHGQAWAK